MAHRMSLVSLAGEQAMQESLRALRHAAGFLRSQLAGRIKLYTTPQLRFVYDESVERGDHLSRLIESTKKRG